MRQTKHLLGLLLVATVALVVTSRSVLSIAGAITLTPLTSFTFNNPIGIDFHEPNGGNLIMSVNWINGSPNNLDLVNVTTQAVSSFSTLANLTDELKIATQRTTACAQFPVGDVFTGNGQPGEIVRLNAAGLVYGPGDFNDPGDNLNAGNPNPGVPANFSWVKLPNALPDDLLRGSLYVDRCNGFNGDLIVVTSIDTAFPTNGGGAVWRIAKTGAATMLNGGNRILRAVGDHCAVGQTCGVHLEGVITVPTSFGPPWGGTIIAGDENDTTDLSRDGKIWSIPASGAASALTLAFDSGGVHHPVKAEDLDIIDDPGGTFFGVNFGNARVLTAPASDFAGSAGDILLTQEFPCGSAHSALVQPCIGSSERTTGLYAVHSDGASLTITPFTFSETSLTDVDTWEHVTFAPLPLPAPSVSIVKLTNGTDNDLPPGPTVPVGSTVTWTYNVTNTGNVPLTSVAVTDDKVGPICTIGTLAAGASASCTKTGIAVAGQYENTGTVTGTPPAGPDVTASNPDHYFAELQPSSVKVEKTGNGPIKIGDMATFTITVTSLGPGAATDVRVTDKLPAGLTWLDDQDACTIASGVMSCDLGTMAPGQVFTVVLKATLAAAAFDCRCVIARHHEGDRCDHERRKSGHQDGDRCEHEKTVRHHFDGDGCSHEKGRLNHHDGDGCDHDKLKHPVDCRIRNTAKVTASNEDPARLGDNSSTASIALAGPTHHKGDRCSHERGKNGHHDGDGCEHEKATRRHFDGDSCDHERSTGGHYSGDGCDHERTGHSGRHDAGDGDDHEKGRFGHKDGDGCDHDKDMHHVFDNRCIVTHRKR